MPTKLFWSVVAVAVLYVVFVWCRRKIAVWLSRTRLHWPPSEAPLLTGLTPIFAARNDGARRGARARSRRSSSAPMLIVTWLIILAILFLTLVDPHLVATELPRLFFAPLLFAGIAVLLSEVAAWSHRRRTPFLLVVMLGAVVCLYYVEHYHDVRWFEGAPKAVHRGRARAADPRRRCGRALDGCQRLQRGTDRELPAADPDCGGGRRQPRGVPDGDGGRRADRSQQ